MNKANTHRRIYIRHADKEYANGDAAMYKHDPGITHEGVKKSVIAAKYLIQEYGVPDRIIVSPYRRTRETAEVMLSVIKSFDHVNHRNIPINIDRDVSEYLGNHRSVPIDVTEDTLTHEPPHPETFGDMKSRVKSHNRKIINYIKRHPSVIWIVTHGLIMKQVASLMSFRVTNEFPSLTCFSIMDGTDITKREIIMFNQPSSTDRSSDKFDRSTDKPSKAKRKNVLSLPTK